MQDPRLVATSSTYSYAYQYDQMGRKTQLTYPPDSGGVQRTETWTYDNVGNGLLSQFKNRKSNIQTLTYDSFNRLHIAHWNDSGVTPDIQYDYNARSSWQTVYSNGHVSRDYYADGLLASETVVPADTVVRNISYTYDSDGRRSNLTYPPAPIRLTTHTPGVVSSICSNQVQRRLPTMTTT